MTLAPDWRSWAWMGSRLLRLWEVPLPPKFWLPIAELRREPALEA